MKETPMGSKRPARREFLKSGAALAGGFTLGGVAPASGQAPASDQAHHSPPMIKEGKDQIAYGDRSPHVTSVRIPHGGRPSPDNWGLDRKSTRLNSSHSQISYAVFCLKKKK